MQFAKTVIATIFSHFQSTIVNQVQGFLQNCTHVSNFTFPKNNFLISKKVITRKKSHIFVC